MSEIGPENKAYVYRGADPAYPQQAPFHSDSALAEFPDNSVGTERNMVYDSVRELFRLAGLDQENFGRPDWNPLAEFVRPGDVVLLKPNLVKESHPRDPQGWEYVLTHGSVIRVVADYLFKALNGTGMVVVGDAPQTDSSFEKIVQILQLDSIAEYYQSRGFPFCLIDLRKEEWTNEQDVITARTKLDGDPEGYVAFDLADKSEFFQHGGTGRYYGADYDFDTVNAHHDGIKNEYLISGSAVKCDLFFNLPKLKTHKKAGVTINLKNLVGVNGDKNWLPHHTEGSPETGGDQFPRKSVFHTSETYVSNVLKKMAVAVPGVGSRLMKLARPVGKKLFGSTDETIRSGNWHGNDTVWRMCLDLNKAVLYGNADGSLREDHSSQRKRYLCLVDGFIGGQGNGPMDPDPYPSGLFIFGTNPVVTDAVSATLMGLDIDRIPTIRHAFEAVHYPLTICTLDEVQTVSNHPPWNCPLVDIRPETTLSFRPHFGWIGNLELSRG